MPLPALPLKSRATSRGGVVIAPKASSTLGSLEFAVDYFDIEVRNGVSQLSGGSILQSCYNDPQFNAGQLGGQLCRLITRAAANSPTPYQATVTSGYVNISVDKVRGLDMNLRYTRDVGPGALKINAQATRYFPAGQQNPDHPILSTT